MAPGDRAAKSRIYDQLGRVAKAAANPKRLELLDILAQGERSVEALAAATAQPMANASQHLKVLREARLVQARRDGLNVFYRLADASVFELLRAVRAVGERQLLELGEAVRAYLGARDTMEPVRREELLARARRGEVVVLDVRPPEEFRAGHLPGAVSIPVAQLGRRLGELRRGAQVVAYCRGPYCVMSHEAVDLLRRRGWKARRLEDGFPEWQAAGLPVEKEERP